MKIRFLWLPALLLCARTAAAAAEPPAQKLLPKDTVMVVAVPDTGKALEVLTNSAMGRLWRDPMLKAFTDKFSAKLQTAAVGPLERQLGIQFADYQGLARGQMTFALIPVDHPAKPDEHYAAVFIIDAGGHAAQLAANLTAVKKKWIDAGKTLKTDNIRGTEFATLMMSTADFSPEKLLPGLVATNDDDILPQAPPEKVELTFGQSGSLLIVSQSSQVIEKILARQAGGMLAGLDEQPDFQRDFAARFQDASLFAWVNIGALMAGPEKPSIPAAGQSLLGDAVAANGAMAALGLTGLTTASIACRDTPEGLNTQIFIGAPESSRRGLLQVLAIEARDSGPPPFVPADAVKFSRIRLDLPKSWRSLEATLNQLSPAYAQSLDYVLGLAGKSDNEKYDLKSELLAYLGDDIMTYQRSPVDTTLGDLQDAPEILLIGSPNPWKLGIAIKTAMGLFVPASSIKDREFLGRRIYTANLPVSLLSGSHTTYFAASSGYVALTGDVEMLEEFLRSTDSDKPGLSRTPGLAEAAQKAGGGMSAGIFTYENDKESMRALLETLRKESVSAPDLLALFGLQFNLNSDKVTLGLQLNSDKTSTVREAGQFKDWCDFSLLPPAGALTKYFNFSVWAGGFTPDGFSLNYFAPAPPAGN
jgi:hypothetical protein